MSMWSAIVNKLKEVLQKMLGARTIETALNVAPVISVQMENAINLWDQMYKGTPSWVKEPDLESPVRVVSLGLPAMIASEKARTALIEFNSEITTPTEDKEVANPNYTEPEIDEYGNLVPSIEPQTIIESKPVSDEARAEYLESQYKKLKKQLRKQVEYGIAKGGLVIKPYVVFNNGEDVEYDADIEFDFIQADNFYPLAFDASGHITEAAFVDSIADKNNIYRRLEYHKWAGNKVTVINKAFKSNNIAGQLDNGTIDLGHEIPLTDVPQWKDLEPKAEIKNVTKPLFGYFKMPEANTIDTSSPLGVSGYSRAVTLIKDADMQYSRLLWEYEAGEMAIDIDRDALKTVVGTDGMTHEVLTKSQERLFRKVDLSSSGDTYQPYNPTLRDTSYINGLNVILMRIEDVVGISRGTLSDVSSEARTATELKILKQRSYQTNADIQQALEDCLQDVIYVMNVYCDLYKITKPGEYDVNFEWDDSIITDVDAELSKRITLMQNGLVSKLENRMWYFGETERQAQEALIALEEENMQSMENDLTMQMNFGDKQSKAFQKKRDEKKKEAMRNDKSSES